MIYGIKNTCWPNKRFKRTGLPPLRKATIFGKATLTTRVYTDGINILFFPLKLSEDFYDFDQITEANKVTYRPILDYGGWEIRYGRKGKAYNVQDKNGVKLWFKSGNSILIGSQRSDKLYEILQREIE